MEETLETPPIGRPNQYATYFKEYYQQNKAECNRNRKANYHKSKNDIPPEKLDAYLKCRSVYNLIKKHKDQLDLDFIKHLLDVSPTNPPIPF
jgi:ribosomal protein S17E